MKKAFNIWAGVFVLTMLNMTASCKKGGDDPSPLVIAGLPVLTVTDVLKVREPAHASKFVPAGSVRIASNISGNLQTVAFKTPAGKKVLIVENDGSAGTAFNIKFNNKWVTTSLPAGGAGTYTW